MPRKPIPPSDHLPYHVTARALNREPFPVPIREMWSLVQDYLFLTTHLYDLQVHSFVLMPNHFHLLVSTPRANIGAAMNYFMRETARETSRLSSRINQTFGARHHKCLIGNSHYFTTAYKYVYRNPVRAGLARRTEEYPYSTLAGSLGLRPLVVPLTEDTILFPGDFDWTALEWLNQAPDEVVEDEVRQALKHSEFATNTARGRRSVLETHLL